MRRRHKAIDTAQSSWDYVAMTNPHGSLIAWQKTIRKLESSGMFPRNGRSVSEMLSQVFGPPRPAPEPRNLFFQFYFSGSAREAREAAFIIEQICRRIVRESSLSR